MVTGAPPLNDEAMASRALAMGCAGARITSFEGGDLEEQVADIYWTATNAMLSIALWRFNTITWQLPRKSEAPNSRWDYAFTLPADRLRDPLEVFFDATVRYGSQDFEIFEDELRCGETTCYISYQRRPSSPGKWSPLFLDFAITSLAADLALAVNEDRARYETLTLAAYGSLRRDVLAGKLGLAVMSEAFTQPPVAVLPDGGPLVRAHHGGSGYSLTGYCEE